MNQAADGDQAGVAATVVRASLADASLAVIAAGQDPSGAYVASPTFSQYGYAWLRDGSFCALAMDAAGRPDSAEHFHRWAARAIGALSSRAERVVGQLEAGQIVPPGQMLPTRYRLDGSEESGVRQWPNFQLDGYGTWLFALGAHVGAKLSDGYCDVVRLVARYLSASWRLPCYDYWEESADRVHTTTLAAVAVGLRTAARLLDEPRFAVASDEVMAFIAANCLADGAFVKGTTDSRVDAALLSLAIPFGLVALDDPRFIRTVARIRLELASPSGGIRRYVGDEYYGGSPWPLLTAWLGWYDRLAGSTRLYEQAVVWVEAHAGPTGTLPEQVVAEPQLPAQVPIWQKRWGQVADPLLWSHAQYLLAKCDNAD